MGRSQNRKETKKNTKTPKKQTQTQIPDIPETLNRTPPPSPSLRPGILTPIPEPQDLERDEDEDWYITPDTFNDIDMPLAMPFVQDTQADNTLDLTAAMEDMIDEGLPVPLQDTTPKPPEIPPPGLTPLPSPRQPTQPAQEPQSNVLVPKSPRQSINSNVPPLDLRNVQRSGSNSRTHSPYGPVKAKAKPPSIPLPDVSPIKEALVQQHNTDQQIIQSLQLQLQQQIEKSEIIESQATSLIHTSQFQLVAATRNAEEEMAQQHHQMQLELEGTIHAAHTELTSYQATIKTLQDQLTSNQEVMTNEHHRILSTEQSQAQMQAEQAMLQQAQNIQKQAQEHLDKINTQHEHTLQQYANHIHEQQLVHQRQLNANTEQINATSARNTMLQTENQTLPNKVNRRQQNLSDQQTQAASTTYTNEELTIRHEARMKQASIHISELNRKLKDQQTTNQTQITSQTEQINQLLQHANLHKDTLTAMQTENTTSHTANHHLQQQIERLQLEIRRAPWHGSNEHPEYHSMNDDQEEQHQQEQQQEGEPQEWWTEDYDHDQDANGSASEEDDYIECAQCGGSWQSPTCCEYIHMSARPIPRTLGDLSPVPPTNEQQPQTTPRPKSHRSNPASPLT